ncbi:hypothetical protein QE442_000638 [Chryseobacterium sp. SORGH_AS1175]|nr:hypothetical protein [Chryseobacterium sp. SORGH_AS_1175]
MVKRLFIYDWESRNGKEIKDILITAGNKNLIDFVYSSELFKELREYLLENNKTIDNTITKLDDNEKGT